MIRTFLEPSYFSIFKIFRKKKRIIFILFKFALENYVWLTCVVNCADYLQNKLDFPDIIFELYSMEISISKLLPNPLICSFISFKKNPWNYYISKLYLFKKNNQ